MQRVLTSRPYAIPVATAPFIFVSIVDGGFRDFLRNAPGWFWSFDMFKFLLLPTLSLLWLARHGGVLPQQYGFSVTSERGRWPQYLGLIALVTAALWFATFVTWTIIWRILGQPQIEAYFANMAPSGALRAPAILYFAATAGLFEEIFFRGLPLLYLEQRNITAFPQIQYVIGTSLVFALIHWENGIPALASTFAWGVLSATFYLQLRDLRPLVIAHTVVNAWEFW
jgi:membrane protease YdiL (CAAX protease family)